MLKKVCNYVGCDCLIDYTDKYCTKHKDTDKEKYKEYKKNRTDLKEQKFYCSKDWLDKRDKTRKFYYGMDIVEYYMTGNVVIGDTVHHIIELKDDWTKRLDLSNLIYLTESNHQRVHGIMEKSEQDKINMQKKLLELRDKFMQDFK